MSDRSGAYLFGTVFGWLAMDPTDENKKRAKWLWSLTGDYDFDRYDMNCDEALVKLGLLPPEDTEDG
jgi:hypothetical protein